MGYVIIKLYANEMQGDFHDLSIEGFEKLFQEMQDYAKGNGKKLYFASMTTDQTIGIPLACTPFAEVEYTTPLTEEEKKQYVEYLKKLCMNAEIEKKYLIDFPTLTMVKFKKIDDEIIEIM